MEKDIKLFPHNELAFNKLTDKLKTNNMVSINHATGTGKSFIILKYLYQNRDKRILILSPTYQILDQFVNVHPDELGIDKSEFKKLDGNIYSNLEIYDAQKIADNYDIVVLDEYHRCGAEKWSQAINELKRIVKKGDNNLKIIGATATEIRYLDNNRDMNEILFDGVNASTLTLKDAILQGILPTFEYVIVPYGMLEELDKLEERANKNIVFEEVKEEYLNKINETKNELRNLLQDQDLYKDYFKSSKKCLVFSSTIDKIKNDSLIVNKIVKNKNIKEYSISSRNSVEKNKNELDDFREKEDITKILYSVNLLNEGVHVKDIDTIFMLRKTISPRIYFQQLGRILSCSKNSKRLIIFDLVNNLSNNKVIYSLYKDVTSEARRLIETDPNNKDRYEKILEEFKIINLYSSSCQKTDEISNKLSLDNIKLVNLEYAIKMLETIDKNSYEYYLALSILFKNQDYLNLEQFNKIKKLDIIKPSIFSLTEEEFKARLNINKGQLTPFKQLEANVLDYYKVNQKLPSIFDRNDEGKNIAKELLNNYSRLPNYFIDQINLMIDDNLSDIEKISYGILINNIDYDQLYTNIKYMLLKKIYISENIIQTLKQKNDSTSNEYIKLIKENNIKLKENKICLDEKLEEIKIDDNCEIVKNKLFSAEFLNIIKRSYENYNFNKEKYLLEVYNLLVEFINNHRRLPKANDEDDMAKRLYIEHFIFKEDFNKLGYEQKIQEMLNIYQKEDEKKRNDQIVKDIIYLIEHYDESIYNPCNNYLFKKYVELYNTSTDEQKESYANERDKFNEYKRMIINRYLLFININKRRPGVQMNGEEKKLAIEFDRIKDALDEREKNLIKDKMKYINKYKETEKFYLDKMRERRLKNGKY